MRNQRPGAGGGQRRTPRGSVWRNHRMAHHAATHETRVMRSTAAVVLTLTLALGFALAACGSTAPSPPRPLGPGERWLPVVDDHGGTLLCGGVGFVGDYRLHGSA